MTTQEKTNEVYRLIYDNFMVAGFILAERKGYTKIDGARDKFINAMSKYVNETVSQMSHAREPESDDSQLIRLDRHKLAACICAAIINVRPLIEKNGEPVGEDVEYANDSLAVWVSMEVLQKTMLHKMSEKISKKEIADDFKKKLYKEYRMKFPPDSYGDKGDYFKNLCNDIGRARDHFDIFAYSRVFYHLEMVNRVYILKDYKKSFPEIG